MIELEKLTAPGMGTLVEKYPLPWRPYTSYNRFIIEDGNGDMIDAEIILCALQAQQLVIELQQKMIAKQGEELRKTKLLLAKDV